jgi:phospholipase D1/2
MPTPTPILESDKFTDPLDESFWKDQWVATAVHNTEIFRKVFRCIPDDLVTSWASYKAFANHAEKFNKVPTDVAGPDQTEPVKVTHDGHGTHGAGGGGSGGGIVGQEGVEQGEGTAVRHNDIIKGKPREWLDSVKSGNSSEDDHNRLKGEDGTVTTDPTAGEHNHKREGHGSGGGGSGGGNVEERNQKSSGPNDAWAEWEKQEMEILLEEVRGHLGNYLSRRLFLKTYH